VMSYISHSQVWGLWQEGTLYMGGITNRAQVTFEREFLEILETLDRPTVAADPPALVEI
jgi:cytochrome c biogenesis protein